MKRHDLDVVSLVFGLVFGTVAGWWGVSQVGDVDVALGWPLAVALLIAGVVGLAGALPRRGPERTADETEVLPRVDDPAGTPDR